MLVVTAHVSVDPARRTEFVAACRDFARTTRTVDGCLQYDVFECSDKPARFLWLEIWRDDDAFARHTTSSRLGVFRATTADLVRERSAEVYRLGPIDVSLTPD